MTQMMDANAGQVIYSGVQGKDCEDPFQGIRGLTQTGITASTRAALRWNMSPEK